jgi:hypothetical protein
MYEVPLTTTVVDAAGGLESIVPMAMPVATPAATPAAVFHPSWLSYRSPTTTPP